MSKKAKAERTSGGTGTSRFLASLEGAELADCTKFALSPAEVAKMLVDWMGPFHEGNEQLQRDEAMRSIGMAMQTIMLTATAMGYQSCPMIGFDHQKVAELIHLPEDHVIGPMVAVGKGTKDSWPKPGQLPLEQVVIKNHF